MAVKVGSQELPKTGQEWVRRGPSDGKQSITKYMKSIEKIKSKPVTRANSEPKTAANKAVANREEQKPADGKNAAPGDQKGEPKPNPDVRNDPVFVKYGEPFLTNDKGKVSMNERAIAVKCASVHQVRYDALTKTYERFDQTRGLWLVVSEIEVRRLLGDLLLKLGEEWQHQEFVRSNKNSHFNSLAKMLQPYQLEVTADKTPGLVHVANGVLDLRDKTAKLLAHEPKYPFKFSPEIPYVAKAECPKFVGDFLAAALEPEDIELVQKYCGSMLLGRNDCHGILVIRGTAGGGKSTLVSIIERVLGEDLVAYLRTKHLAGRFETSAFIGKRVLLGKDVPGDTLSENGARLLKSLVGGDLLQAEIKYNPTKQSIRGDYHVILASNNRLRIALDGDEEAWRRRLLIVDFEKPKPTKPIPDYADKLVAEERSGILNWLIAGAFAYRDEMTKRGSLALTEKQTQRVAALLEESDSVLSFTKQFVTAQEDADVSSDELLLGYYRRCKEKQWKPVSGHEFQVRIPDLLTEQHSVCKRHDIKRDGKAVRGFKELALV